MNSQIAQKVTSTYSLEADMATGWKPKLKIIGPMPLNFDNSAVDKSIMALLYQESAFYQICYLGPRPISSFKMHQLVAKEYRYKYTYLLHNDFAHLKPFFKKFYSLFEPQIRRPFIGMNPNIGKHELIFDSCFQGGNLDCAVRIKALEYDLILRADSNTSGHVLWYHFRATNSELSEKTVKFNIVNLRSNKSAYERGMRPFVKRSGRAWHQEGQNVEVKYESLRYHKQNLILSMYQSQPQILFRKLSFELDLAPQETVEIAYCVPYSYSRLLEDIKDFKKKASQIPEISLDINLEYESLSGVEIPIIKIRSGTPGNGKFCIFMIGRQHPGESNGSHVLKGSIDQLLSGSSLTMKVLQHCDFVIIPMLNPDGVIAGNFRTSLFGKDMNRLWKSKDTTLIPEVQMARTVFSQLVDTYKKKLLLFLDYHGHSTRKNAFLLGPGILDAQLMNDIRILPKIMANYTQIFRYQSCSFRLDQNKKTTARALFGKLTGLSFTIETSNWAYYSHATREAFEMQVSHFQQLGICLFKGVEEFIMGKVQAKSKYNQRIKEQEGKRLKIFKNRQDIMLRKSVTSREIQSKQIIRFKDLRTKTQKSIPQSSKELKKISRIIEEEPLQLKQANQSDDMSQNGMDSDSAAEDMESDKFNKYIKNAADMLIQFQNLYYGDDFKKGMSKYNVGTSKSSKIFLKKEKKKKPDFVQPCMKQKEKKMMINFQSEKRSKKNQMVYIEDIMIRQTSSRSKQERRQIQIQDSYRRDIFSNWQDSPKKQIKKTKVVMRDPIGLTEQISRNKRFDLLNLNRSNQYKKHERSTQRLRCVPKPNNINLVKYQQKQIRNTIDLPLIKSSKHILDEVQSPICSKKIIPKSKNTMNDLLISEQLLNRTAIVNVLKLSRMERLSKIQ